MCHEPTLRIRKLLPILFRSTSMTPTGSMCFKLRSLGIWTAGCLIRGFVATISILSLTASTAVRAVEAETLQVLGQAGVLGEWELTANISPTDKGVGKLFLDKSFSGPLLMKHVGICSVDGPEQKTGEIRLQILGSSRVKATLVVEGVTCTYAGRKLDSYSGVLRCPNQRDVPLLIWLK